MAKNTFEDKFKTILEPVLRNLGFAKVVLNDCMRPQFLFNKERLWFSLSWDWRDRYLDVSLGHLFWFKDVMERVVVIGDYSNYEDQITPNAIDKIGSDTKVLNLIANSLGDATSQYEEEYEKIFQDFRVSRSRRGGINIDEYIGEEVTIKDLKRFEA
ncbi:MAG: hypothetical protein GY729_01860 [Desulfobacteraceae bacterium]|nr:hypothetical protein [Desulfobacteraceae bacterium]